MTRLEFLLKTFATNTEQMRGMLDNQQTIVDTLVEKGKETKDNTYSDIVSDGGLDPRTKYEAERFKRPWVFLTDEEIDELLDGMSLGCCARDVRIVQEKLKEKNNAS